MKYAKVITEGFGLHYHVFEIGDKVLQVEERDEDGHIAFRRLSDGTKQYLDDCDVKYINEEETK